MHNGRTIRTLILWVWLTFTLLLGGCQEASLPSSPLASRSGQTVPPPHPPFSRELTVHFIDVGQGDSILAQWEGHSMLIDAGENDQGPGVVSYLKHAGVTSLDYVIGTHPHSDHIGGLDDVLREFPVKKVILPPVEHTTETFEDVLDVIAEKGMKITMPKTGDSYALGDASFEILAPAGDYGSHLNNWSVGVKLSYQSNSLIMCGDAEQEGEEDIVAHNQDLTADVLKAGHHGSSTSTCDSFLEAVSPTYVVIQCGKDNSYGHPHRETLEKLENRGIQVLRTDQEGTLVAVCDGSTITWNSSSQTAAPSRDPNAPQKKAYVLNINSKKFHLPTCPSVSKIKETNRQDVSEYRYTLIEMGFTPCGQCNP